MRPERSGDEWGSGELPEGLIVASSLFDYRYMHLLSLGTIPSSPRGIGTQPDSRNDGHIQPRNAEPPKGEHCRVKLSTDIGLLAGLLSKWHSVQIQRDMDNNPHQNI
mgnify:CR=1 FL=1